MCETEWKGLSVGVVTCVSEGKRGVSEGNQG